MSLRVIGGLLSGVFVLNATLSFAQNEEERRRGFYEKQKENQLFDQEREAGLKDYLREQAEWEEQRKKDIAADKKRKKEEAPQEGGVEYKVDRNAKYEDYENYEASRRAYVREKKILEPKNAKEAAKREAWAMEEYGLDKERPRFDVSKRNFSGSKGGSAPSSPGFSGGNTGTPPSFPPPPVFDDFGGEEGFVPPPFPAAEPFEGAPPEGFPPPVPFPDNGNDMDGGFPPPPPPPPIPPPGDGDF